MQILFLSFERFEQSNEKKRNLNRVVSVDSRVHFFEKIDEFECDHARLMNSIVENNNNIVKIQCKTFIIIFDRDTR